MKNWKTPKLISLDKNHNIKTGSACGLAEGSGFFFNLPTTVCAGIAGAGIYVCDGSPTTGELNFVTGQQTFYGDSAPCGTSLNTCPFAGFAVPVSLCS